MKVYSTKNKKLVLNLLVILIASIFLIIFVKNRGANKIEQNLTQTSNVDLTYSSREYGFSITLPSSWTTAYYLPDINRSVARGTQYEKPLGSSLTYTLNEDERIYHMGIEIFSKEENEELKRRMRRDGKDFGFEYIGENKKYVFYFYKYTSPACKSDCSKAWTDIDAVKERFVLIPIK